MLELLREEQGGREVGQQEDRQDQSDEGSGVDWHGLPQLLARLDVEKRQDEENYSEKQHG
jgi:hypothetical protein